MSYAKQQQQQQQNQEPAQNSGSAMARHSRGCLSTAEKLHKERMERLASFPERNYRAGLDGITAVVVTDGAKPCAFGFRGRSIKPAFRYSFADSIKRDSYVTAWLETENKAIAERQAAKQKAHTLAVGDVLYSSWGWEQTNISFYEVVAVRGAVVDLRLLHQDKRYTSDVSGTCTPCRGSYAGDVLKGKRPNGDNRIRLNSYSSASVYDGIPKAWTSYA
ncbi:hypothetical protein LMG31884_47200 (plasmid) [Xanthomonas hydrangeae]|nr:hypothetical protein LMG31884_47200 [Xanthomonas hydrangeae]CAD7741039.1 hypothetical protein LMG31884_47200 [Xanthomonas hydrangeae]CAD7747980.1 hypothetical protein LMG31887_46610 [Xanthomonas hydrangeae]CAD7747981.1 hypothetical protein LMG31887_46610 [Xanthomonas hydrangeae]CAD7748142.1 hypothetical protein LMG31885_44880 [Xanthomonas hydrangeae]